MKHDTRCHTCKWHNAVSLLYVPWSIDDQEEAQALWVMGSTQVQENLGQARVTVAHAKAFEV